MKLRKHYRGCYRLTLDRDTFAQFLRDGRQWRAEIRYTESGSIKRYAGIWPSLAAAVADVTGA